MLLKTDYTIYMLPAFDRVSVRVRFNVHIKYGNSMFLKIRCRRVDQSASYPVRDLTDCKLVCRRVVL